MIRIRNYKLVTDEVKKHLKEYLEMKGIIVNGKSFKCFNHSDTNASAGLTADGKGFKCFTCDTKGDIFTAYNIIEGKSIKGQDFFYALKELSDIFHVEYEVENGYNYEKENKVKDNEYIYTDTDGKEIYKIVRYHKEDENGNTIIKANGKAKKTFGAYIKVEDKWQKGMDSKRRYLYNSVDVMNAIKNNDDVFLVEGEKCVEILKKKFGLTATTIPFGSTSWTPPYISQYTYQLKNANVILLPDNDKPGYNLMNTVAKDIIKTSRCIFHPHPDTYSGDIRTV